MKTMLTSLPNEVLLLVFRHLQLRNLIDKNDYERPRESLKSLDRYEDGLRNLSSVCLTCSLFRDLAQPLLYSHHVRPDSWRMASAWTKQQSFMWTLVNRQDLAKAVTALYIEPWACQPWVEKRRLEQFVPDADLRGKMAKKFSNSPFVQDLLGDLSAGSEDAEVAFLLAVTTRVSELFLDLYRYDHSPDNRPYLQRFMREPISAGGAAPGFMFLKSVTLHGGRENGGFPLETCSAFFLLPSLEEFNLIQVADKEGNADGWLCGSGTSAVRKLGFHNCCLHPDMIKAIIDSCMGLADMTLDINDEKLWGPPLTWSRVFHAFDSQRSSLRSLTLASRCTERSRSEYLLPYYSNQHPPFQDEVLNESDFPPLKDYIALRSLRIDASVLFGRNIGVDHEVVLATTAILPPSLVNLELDQVSYAKDVLELVFYVRHGLETLPNLRRIRVNLLEMEPMVDEHRLMVLRDWTALSCELSSNGVDFYGPGM